MDVEAYYDLTQIYGVSVSPDGERVAYLATEADPDADETRRSIFVVPTDGTEPPHRLTRASDAGAPKWSPDGRYLAFTAAREEDTELAVSEDEDAFEEDPDTEDGGKEEPRSQVWLFDLALGGDARQITTRDRGVDDFDWGPDGERLVIAAADPDDEQTAYLKEVDEGGPIEIERLQHKRDGAGWTDETTSYLFVVDVEGRETTRLDRANDRGYDVGLQPAWGKGRIAYVSSEADDPDDTAVKDIYTIRPDGTGRERVTDGTLAASQPFWSPDGDRLAFMGRDPENFYVPTELYVTDANRDTYASVSASLDRTLDYGGFTWLDESTILGPIADEGWTRLCRFDADSDSPERTFDVQDSLETIGRGGRVDVDGGTVAGVFSAPAAGADLYSFPTDALDADSDPRTRLTTVNDELLTDGATLECHRITYESADDESVEAIAYTDAEFDPDAPTERPLLLKIHGGPMSYDAPGWGFDEQFFVDEGYLVLEVNYRGSTSYGSGFCEPLRGAWNDLEVADLQAGVDSVIERGWVDQDRLFVTGFSQGGVNTGYLVTATDRFAAAAAEHGIYDLYSSFGTDDSQVWLEADNGLPWENPERYRRQSSIGDVGAVETPTLVTCGEADWRCPPSQSEQFYVSLRKQGVESKLVVYQGEHHNIGAPDRAIHRLEELREWFAEHDPAAE
ncbi:MAG: prolyl oligopeptidase family serine peptidase [Halodesulfurarchaeum sp.]